MSRSIFCSLALCCALLAQEADLSASFKVDNADGAISHTPAVVYSADGSAFFAGLSNGEVVAFATASGEITQRHKASQGSLLALALSSDARRLVGSAAGRGLFLRDVEAEKDLAEVAGVESFFLAIRPGDAEVAVVSGDGVAIYSLKDLSLVRSFRGALVNASGVAWSPDGTRLAAIDHEGRLIVFDVAEERQLFTLKHELALYAVAFSPRGDHVAFGGLEKKVYELNLESEEVVVLSAEQPYDITTLGYNPEGDVLAIGDESCDIWLLSVAEKKHLFHDKHHVECWLSQVAWSPDGEDVTFGCRPNTLAAKPALYDNNLYREAFSAENVQDQQKTVLALRDKQLERLMGEGLAETRAAVLARLVERGWLAEDAAEEAQRAALSRVLAGDDAAEQQTAQAQQQQQLWSFGDLNINNLVQEGQPQQQAAQGSGFFIGEPQQAQAGADLPQDAELVGLLEDLRSRPELAELAEQELAARKSRDQAYLSNLGELQDSWCINKWRVKRD